ncbi:VP7 [Hirame aquareovirus]|nr:VP7 [Hirame aquareovirus]
MDTKPIHPTIASAVCDALLAGHLTGADRSGIWRTTCARPEALSTGQYVVCAACFKVVSAFTKPSWEPIAHDCHGRESVRNVGVNLASNLLTMMHTIRRCVFDASYAMEAFSDQPTAAIQRGLGRYPTTYNFAEVSKAISAAMQNDKGSLPIVHLDQLSAPINTNRALTFYGKDLAQHPILSGQPTFSLLERAYTSNRAVDLYTGQVIVQTSGMPIPVMIDSVERRVVPLMSLTDRAVITHAILTHSCASGGADIQRRCYGSRGRDLVQVACDVENMTQANRGMKRIVAGFYSEGVS